MSPRTETQILLNHELPSTVGAVKDGWQLTCQSSAVVTVLLAGIEAQLLSYLRSPQTYAEGNSSWQTAQATIQTLNSTQAAAIQTLNLTLNSTQSAIQTLNSAQYAVLTLCYAGLFLSIGATISAFVMIDKLGSMPYVSAKSDSGTRMIRNTSEYLVGKEVSLLKIYGVGKSWEKLVWHWFICFYGGILCIVTQLLTFIVLQEPLSVKVIVAIIGAFAVLPPTLCLFCPRLQ